MSEQKKSFPPPPLQELSSHQQPDLSQFSPQELHARLVRYESMAADLASYREYSAEMENIQAQMNMHGKTTKIRWQLQNQFDTYRVAQETYLEKALAKYQVTDLAALRREMEALEPLIEAAYSSQAAPAEPYTTLTRAYTTMCAEQETRRPSCDLAQLFTQAEQEYQQREPQEQLSQRDEEELER